MQEMPEYRARARELLSALDLRFNSHVHAIEDLRASGVSERRIEALYPFNVDDWKEACSKLAFGAEYHTVDARQGLPSQQMLFSTARCLDDSQPEAAKVHDAFESAGKGQDGATSRLRRLLITGLLLHAISLAEKEQMGYDIIFAARVSIFFAEVHKLLKALELTPDTALPWAVNS